MTSQISIKSLMNTDKDPISKKLHVNFDHLVLRLINSGVDAKYIDSLKDFSEIPGFTYSDHYSSFYDLMTTYNELLTRKKLIEQYLDESISIVNEILTANQKSNQWKKTQLQH